MSGASASAVTQACHSRPQFVFSHHASQTGGAFRKRAAYARAHSTGVRCTLQYWKVETLDKPLGDTRQHKFLPWLRNNRHKSKARDPVVAAAESKGHVCSPEDDSLSSVRQESQRNVLNHRGEVFLQKSSRFSSTVSHASSRTPFFNNSIALISRNASVS